MAKSKKTKKEEVLEFNETNVSISQKKYEDCEWCFQFDEDEPQIFAWTDNDLNKNEDPKVIFTITNTKDSYITFTHKNGKSGKVFKLFARELTEEGKSLRQKQKEAFKKYNNESQNKETEA